MRWTAIVVLGALVRAAHADDASDAETLFNEGVKAKEAGKPAEACAKFRASYEKNRNAVGTILNVALCDEEAGKHRLGTQAVRRGRGSREGAEPRGAREGGPGAQGAGSRATCRA